MVADSVFVVRAAAADVVIAGVVAAVDATINCYPLFGIQHSRSKFIQSLNQKSLDKDLSNEHSDLHK